MSMKLTYWGVRGSLPSSPPPKRMIKDIEQLFEDFFNKGFNRPEQIKEYLSSKTIPTIGGFGTATTCVEVNGPQTQIIIDGGSGIRNLSEKMMTGSCGQGKGEVHIFLTHFHWDHIVGLPFFAPLFVPGNKINFYAVQSDLEDVIRWKFRKPFFPVPFEALGSQIKFHTLEPRKPLVINEIKVTPYMLDHPDPCWGFKVESGGKGYAHCVDTEGTRISREALGLDLPLYQGVDLMYFDAQYTLPELAEKSNWGHSAAQLGLDLAFREKINYVIFAHHDPGASKQQIFELKTQTEEYYNWRKQTAAKNHQELHQVKWRFAYEGFEIHL
jgi:phosphoribosyl 1,2-cyclic phosphodiesterase